jgi:uncharacterized protein with HEPN domain
MIDFAEAALSFTRGRLAEDIDDDRQLEMALSRAIELIGEAANRLPARFLEENPEIEWREIIGMRNILVHGYDIVDSGTLWRTATSDAQDLIDRLRAILEAAP